MWVHVPGTSSPSVQGTVDLISHCDWRFQMLARSAWLNGKDTSPQSWCRGWKRHCWIKHLFGLICEPSMAALGVERFIASLPASPASHSPRQDDSGSRTIRDTCGHMSEGSLANAALPSSSSRMLPTCYDVGSSLSRMTYDRWVTELRRVCLRRRKQQLRTIGNACLFWPGPGHPTGLPLTWATPTARDWKDGSCTNPDIVATKGLLGRQALRQGPTGWLSSNKRPILNPDFVEWLMGVPISWTASGRAAMESYRQWQHSHLRTYRECLVVLLSADETDD